jgi:hypothetical protein
MYKHLLLVLSIKICNNRCVCIVYREISVKIKITKPQDLGLLIRATRKQQKLRLDDVAGSAGLGPVFVREVERGKETVQFGRVIRLLQELGIELNADVADDVLANFEKLQIEGVKPLPPKRRFSVPKVGAA